MERRRQLALRPRHNPLHPRRDSQPTPAARARTGLRPCTGLNAGAGALKPPNVNERA